jgi:hypothetical protein
MKKLLKALLRETGFFPYGVAEVDFDHRIPADYDTFFNSDNWRYGEG